MGQPPTVDDQDHLSLGCCWGLLVIPRTLQPLTPTPGVTWGGGGGGGSQWGCSETQIPRKLRPKQIEQCSGIPTDPRF